MAIVKLEAITALQVAIAAAVPALAGAITVHQEVPATVEVFPSLAIVLPQRFQYEPAQRLMQADLGGNTVVWNVGAHEGVVQLRITASTSYERMQLEAQLTDWLLGAPLQPGVRALPVVSAPSIPWVAAFEYEDSSYIDVRALEREYEAVITLNAVIPALTTETNVYTIDKLILGLTEDMSTAFTPSTAIRPAVELVQINQDGTITLA